MPPINWLEVGNARVAMADCLDAMASLQAGTLDAVITDPPYCSGGSTEAERTAARSQGVSHNTSWFVGDNMTTTGLVWLLRHMAIEAHRLLTPDGSLLVFADWRMVPALAPALEASGLRWRNLVAWDKGYPGLGVGFRPQHEMVLHFSKGRLPRFDTAASNVISERRVPGVTKRHPTEKPVELLRSLIRATTPPGGVVGDFFAGSGSTGEAALKEGRHAILAERDGRFEHTIIDRVKHL